jgi:hypothetical protein
VPITASRSLAIQSRPYAAADEEVWAHRSMLLSVWAWCGLKIVDDGAAPADLMLSCVRRSSQASEGVKSSLPTSETASGVPRDLPLAAADTFGRT